MNRLELVGRGHAELIQWLTEDWLPGGSPICFLEGFSGVGKTTVARTLLASVKIPAVMITVPDTEADPTDDILLDLALELSLVGRNELAEAVDAGQPLPFVLAQVMQNPLLIVIDEFQRTMRGETSKPVKSLTDIFDRVVNRQRLQGRILLLSNRTIERARWSEPYAIRTLHGLDEDEAEKLLDRLLAEVGRQQEVPADRRRDVVNWLGGNPRAMRVLVASLGLESLDDLVGLSPEIWEVRDRPVSQELVWKLERELLQRTLSHLSDEYNLQLRRLAVYRKAFKRQAIEALFQDQAFSTKFKDEAINYFLMEQHLGWFNLHPIVREIGLQRLKESPHELRQAHAVAARHYTRHFQVRQVVGWGRLGGYFVEARYHLVNADRAEDLRDIATHFEAHIVATIKGVSPVPQNAEELNERIAVLSALLETPGPKGLEYHLARLFQARRRTGDLERAIEHVLRAMGTQAPAPTWVLCGELLMQAGRVDEAIKLLKKGIGVVPTDQNLFSLYHSCGELLAQEGRVDEAIDLFQEGIWTVPADKGLVSLYQSCGELLAQAGQANEAIALLKEGIEVVPADKNLFSLYQSCGELLAQAGRVDEAIKLLKKGIGVVPADKSLFSLYKAAGNCWRRRGGWTRRLTCSRKASALYLWVDSTVTSCRRPRLVAHNSRV